MEESLVVPKDSKKKPKSFKAKMTSALDLYGQQATKYQDHHEKNTDNMTPGEKSIHNSKGRRLGRKLRGTAMKFAYVNDLTFDKCIKLLPEELKKLMYAFRKAINAAKKDDSSVLDDINIHTAKLFDNIHTGEFNRIKYKDVEYTISKDDRATFLQNIDMFVIHAYLNTYRMGVKDTEDIYTKFKNIRNVLRVYVPPGEKAGGSEADFKKLKSSRVFAILEFLSGGTSPTQAMIRDWCSALGDVVTNFTPGSAKESTTTHAAFSNRRPEKLKKRAAIIRRNIKHKRGLKSRGKHYHSQMRQHRR